MKVSLAGRLAHHTDLHMSSHQSINISAEGVTITQAYLLQQVRVDFPANEVTFWRESHLNELAKPVRW